MNDTAILILAAGNSSRLGRPKQALAVGHLPLLAHVLTAAINARPRQVLVVTGAHEQTVLSLCGQYPVTTVSNPHWSTGMASSISAGLSALPEEAAQAIIAVCDQPFVTAALFRQLATVQAATGKPIVASGYSDTAGVPVLFNRCYFSRLMALQGDQGARQLLRQHRDEVAIVPFPEGAVDIDTAEDYQRLAGTGSDVLISRLP